MPSEITVTVNMGFTHSEFKRLLPKALRSDDYVFEKEDRGMRVNHSPGVGQTIRITVSPHRVREITPLVKITNIDVEFVFSGFSEAEADEKMRYIRRGFQKGGG